MVNKSTTEHSKDQETRPPHRVGWGFGGTLKCRNVANPYCRHDGTWEFPLVERPKWGAAKRRTPDQIRCGKATMPDSVANDILVRSVANKNATIIQMDRWMAEQKEQKDKEITDLKDSFRALTIRKDKEIRQLKDSVYHLHGLLLEEKLKQQTAQKKEDDQAHADQKSSIQMQGELLQHQIIRNRIQSLFK